MIKSSVQTLSVALTEADTEVSLELGTPTAIVLHARDNDVKVAWREGDIEREVYFTQVHGEPRTISDITGKRTLYCATHSASATLEVEVWS